MSSSPELKPCVQTYIKPSSELGVRWFARVFAILIWKLRLEDKEPKQILKFNHYYPYCFRKNQAISALRELELEVVPSSEDLRISVSMSYEEASSYLQRFFAARLLHHPRERTSSVVKDGLELQPTPKGVAFLREEFAHQSLPAELLPPILRSCFNSMLLTALERDSNGDILYLRSLLFMLFIRMMGKVPHRWDANAEHVAGRKSEELQENVVDNVEFTVPKTPTQGTYASGLKKRYNHRLNFLGAEVLDHTNHPVGPIDTFPGYHRYFLNPESDAHVQYFVSGNGVRLLGSVDVVSKDGTAASVSNCLTGKAVLQWLSDCTDCLNDSQALGLANLVLTTRLIEPIKSSQANHDYFVGSSGALYRISRLGLKVCHWDSEAKSESSTGMDSLLQKTPNFVLLQVYSDAGLRCLFREHLKSEHCVENYEFYISCNIFQHLVIQLVEKERSGYNKRVISRLKERCIAVIMYIFSGFLAFDSPYSLNINSDMRSGVSLVVLEFARGLETLTEVEAQLVRINGLLKDVQREIWRLMEADSLPKFLESEALEDMTKTVLMIDGRDKYPPFAIDSG